MPCFLVIGLLVVCLQQGVIWVSASTAVLGQCQAGCTCIDVDGDDWSKSSKVAGLAAAVAALTPMVLGGAGLGLYKLLSTAGQSATDSADSAIGADSSSLPKQQMKRGQQPGNDKDFPNTSYHGLRRGSVPLSLFSEDDDLSMDSGGSPRTVRPDTSSTYTNIHRPYKRDAINRWL